MDIVLVEAKGFPHQTPGAVATDRVSQFLSGGKADPERLGGGWIKKKCYRLPPYPSPSPI